MGRLRGDGGHRLVLRCPWTVESLARAVGVSRSVLADRFAEMVGQPPMQYLTLWRMQLASRLLLQGESVAADRLGAQQELSRSA